MNDGEIVAKISWSIEQRLEFIEFRLFWDGKVNRADLVDFFNISIPQASADIKRYLETAPDNIIYDKKVKSYLVTAEFKPLFLKPNAQTYLSQLRSIKEGQFTESESWIGWIPPYEIVPTIVRRVDTGKLRKILDVIHANSAVYVRYQSFSRPEPFWRWLSPHALSFDGFRWHARAWCEQRKAFRDFVLGRMLEIGESKPTEIDAQLDLAWHNYIIVRIGPNPKLSKGARKAIELDYGMEQGELPIKTRICFVYYLQKRFGLDKDDIEIPPESQQLILLNRDEIDTALKKTTTLHE